MTNGSQVFGFLDFWISGFLDFGISGFLDFRIFGFLDFWNSGFLDFRILDFHIFLDFWLPTPIHFFAKPIQKLVLGSGKLSAPSPSKKLRFIILVRNIYQKSSKNWMTVFGSRVGVLVSGTKNITKTNTKHHFWISRFLDFWILGFLDFWISGFLDFWISGFLDFRIFGFLDFWIFGFLAGIPHHAAEP